MPRDKRHHDELDHYLDALVAGKPAPTSAGASDINGRRFAPVDDRLQHGVLPPGDPSHSFGMTGSDSADLDDVMDAAHQVHELAARAEHHASSDATAQTMQNVWEDIMVTTLAPSINTAPVRETSVWSRTGASRQDRPQRHVGRTSAIAAGHAAQQNTSSPLSRMTNRWSGLVSGAMVAALMIGMIAGFQGFNGGLDNGSDGEPTQLAAVLNQEGTPADGAAVIPDASECMVQPLTVDEVIDIVKDPYATQQLATPEIIPASGGNGSSQLQNVPPPQEVLNAVAADHREWMACVIKGSYFQAWALEEPWRVREEILGAFPPFASEEEVREVLMSLETEGQAGPFRPLAERYGADTMIWLVDPNPYHSTLVVDGRIELGVILYDENGTPVRSHPATLDDSIRLPWVYTWSEQRDRWLLEAEGGAG